MVSLPRYVGGDWLQFVVIAFMESPSSGSYIIAGWLLPGRKRVVPYSIQWLKRLRPALFRQDLIALLDLLKQQKIKPLIAQRFPLVEARHAHELLGKGGVTGKIVLVRSGRHVGTLNTDDFYVVILNPGSDLQIVCGNHNFRCIYGRPIFRL